MEKKKCFQVKLVKFSNPDGYCLMALVQAEDAAAAVIKAEKEHPGLFATSAEFLCEC